MSPRTSAITGVVATLITAACAGSGGTAPARSTSRPDSAATGVLSVRIAIYGGPMRPDGRMAMNGQAAKRQPVLLRDARGRVWHGSTGEGGTAVFTVPAGRYRVSSSYCGIPTSVTLAAGTSRPVALQCDVP
ncbi:MAG TPA: hypothetical protein VGN18_20685 [Jatrophihabitans sp.]|jgi:hypothetical protein|uniref:hypothetical protein n=1 Tax=Jatrophihabitans sp. TaxID=1932789 RepID=UPI002DFF26E5|nr:hypothetical protein [Jatrophihabitans sp.]